VPTDLEIRARRRSNGSKDSSSGEHVPTAVPCFRRRDVVFSRTLLRRNDFEGMGPEVSCGGDSAGDEEKHPQECMTTSSDRQFSGHNLR